METHEQASSGAGRSWLCRGQTLTRNGREWEIGEASGGAGKLYSSLCIGGALDD